MIMVALSDPTCSVCDDHRLELDVTVMLEIYSGQNGSTYRLNLINLPLPRAMHTCHDAHPWMHNHTPTFSSSGQVPF
jgi:hypothetical protein